MKSLTNKIFKQNISDSYSPINYKGSKPCIIHFYDSTCIPCNLVEKEYHDLSKELKEKVIFYHINSEEEPELSQKLNIKFIPTILFFNKKVNKKAIGALSKNKLKNFINQLLLNESK